MQNLLVWLQDYSTLVTLTSAIFTAIATGLIAWFTIVLARENSIVRKMQSNPIVTAFLRLKPDGSGLVNLVIANVGNGPAFNVAFEFSGDAEEFRNHCTLIEFSARRAPFNVIPAGDQVEMYFGLGFELSGGGRSTVTTPLKPFSIKIRYTDKDGKERSDSQILDITQFEGLVGLIERPDSKRVADALEAMCKELPNLLKRIDNLNTFVESTRLEDQYRQYLPTRAPGRSSGAADGNQDA